MPHDAPDQPAAPTEDQMVRWLRALADAVERDPDLAARVVASTQGASDGEPERKGQLISPAGPRGATQDTDDEQHYSAGQAISPADPRGGTDRAGQAISPADPRGAEPPRSELRTPYGAEVGDESSVGPAETIASTLRHTRRSSRYGAPSVAGRPAELGTGVPDPFALFAESGEAGLRGALAAVRIGTLRAIIRAHALDPQGKLSANATEKRLIAVILAAAKHGTAELTLKKSEVAAKASSPKKKARTLTARTQ